MTMSTGDSRRSPQKSNPAATDDTGASVPDGPVGGVLPVKKARPATKAAGGGSAGRTAGNGARTGSAGSGSNRRNGAGAGRNRTAPAKATAVDESTVAESVEDDSIETAPSRVAAKSTAAKTTTAKATKAAPGLFGSKPATKATARAGGRGPAAFGGRGPAAFGGGKGGKKRPVTAVRVAERRNWGPIALYVGTAVVALLIIGFGAWPLIQQATQPTWQERAASISGIVNYLDENSPSYNAAVRNAQHVAGDLTYPMSPPVGGNHNGLWQNCQGVVYTSQIADEHAVHSLEHGAVWIAYRPDLPQDQIDKLASKVRDRDFMMMSPYPGLDRPISLQAWGYQLKVDTANDSRIDAFINSLRINATQEETAGCSGGITDASPTPLDLGDGM